MTIAKVTSKGQITVPKAVRERLGLAPGDELEFMEIGGQMVIRRHETGSRFQKYRGYLKHHEGPGPGRAGGGDARPAVITALDTNVLLDVLIPDARFAEASQRLLDEAQGAGSLVIGEIVYAELAAHFGAQRELDVRFLADTRIHLEPPRPEALVRAAQAWREYSSRRDRELQCPRCEARQTLVCPTCGERLAPRQHILSDFLVGAHATSHADRLVTRDRGYYNTYFPALRLMTP